MFKNPLHPTKNFILSWAPLPYIICVALILLNSLSALAQIMPVSASHPRIFLDPATKTMLLAKKANNDADWLSVLADANKYLPHQVIEWNETTASETQYYGTGDIFYSYCGSSWEEAAITLGMAHQLTKTNNAGANATAYSNKLLQLADVIIKAYKDFPPNGNYQPNIFQFNSSYATRHVGKTIGIIYDWCYSELGATRKAALLHVMTDWFTFMSDEPYRLNQLQDDPTGNYFMGHVICSAYLGYAIGSDDPLSQKMIQFARQRVLGDVGSLNTDKQVSAETSYNYFTQSVKGGLPSGASKAYLGPNTITAAPQKDGIPVQGWSYGGETNNFLIDYCFLVKSATGENMLQTDAAFKQYFAKTSEAIVHSYTPNRFQYDNSNDNGSFVGCTAAYALPLRLTALLEGTPEGGNIEYFYKNLLQPVNLSSSNHGYPAESWVKLLYSKTRVATAFTYKPYYPIPDANVYTAIPANASLNKFYIRNNWGPTSTWATLDMGVGVYDQHNHNNAGHFKIIRGDSHEGDDHLLVGANEVAKNGGFGIEGATNYSYSSSLSNTLFINDYNDYDTPYPEYPAMVGGQTSGGYDEPTHQEQNDNFSYFRSDLTSAYLVSYDNPDTTQRTVRYYYRSFIYLRNSDIFLTYDKFLAKNSTNPLGQYKKHIRWHFLNQPVISGNNITATLDNSKLYIHTVWPAALNVASVDESNNPDNEFGSDVGYIFNTNTWRAEVSAAGNPLKQDIVTVLQPGAKTAAEMVTTPLKSNQNNMEGSIVVVNGNTEVVLFNSSVSKYLVPVSMTSYTFTGAGNTQHTLCGMDPGKKYQVTYLASTVTVTESPSGTETASPSGVLSFKLQASAGTNATLTNLTISSGTLAPVFTGATTSYTAAVPTTTAAITLIPTAADATAKIKVNGVLVTSATASASLPLAVGANTITTLVTAQDGTTTKTYTLTVTRAAAATNAALANLTISSGTLAPVFAAATTSYTTTVGAVTTGITVTPTLADATASVRVNGITITSGSASANIPLSIGTNIITTVVTAQDGITTKTYTLTVTRAALTPLPGNPPTAQATLVKFNNTTATATGISWTNGNGATRAVFIAKTANGSSAPVDYTYYSSNASFGNGKQIGTTGWYCIYNGTGSSTTVNGLTTGNTYRVHVVEYNGTIDHEKYLSSPGSPANVTTPLAAPTTQAILVKFNNTTATTTGISWTNGNGVARAVFIAKTANGNVVPADNTYYSSNANFGNGKQVGTTGWYCIYNGTGNSTTVTGLATGNTYRVLVAEYNGAINNEKYLSSPSSPANVTTVLAAPTSQALLVKFNNTTASSTGITWTNGNGIARAVFIAKTANGSAGPADNTYYSSNANFGNGKQVGATGWYCIYNGTGSSTTVTGLATGSTYRVHVVEYNGAINNEKYLASPGSPANVSTPLVAPSAQALLVKFNNTTSSSTGISWTNGNGTARVVLIAKTNNGNTTLNNNTYYSPNANFGNGKQVGITGWYSIYNGTGNSTTVTGLTAGSTYRVLVIEYNGLINNEQYMSSASSPANVNTLAATASMSGGVNNDLTLVSDVKTTATTDIKVIASNILSPNGDGQNDTWVIKNIQLFPDNVITVYDASGKTVLSQRGYVNDWDGSYHGSLLNEGTYNYVINLGAGIPVVRGFITIVRNR